MRLTTRVRRWGIDDSGAGLVPAVRRWLPAVCVRAAGNRRLPALPAATGIRPDRGVDRVGRRRRCRLWSPGNGRAAAGTAAGLPESQHRTARAKRGRGFGLRLEPRPRPKRRIRRSRNEHCRSSGFFRFLVHLPWSHHYLAGDGASPATWSRWPTSAGTVKRHSSFCS